MCEAPKIAKLVNITPVSLWFMVRKNQKYPRILWAKPPWCPPPKSPLSDPDPAGEESGPGKSAQNGSFGRVFSP